MIEPVPQGLKPNRIEVSTPEGKLCVTWAMGHLIYSEGLEPVAYEPPVDSEPYITLDVAEITREQADAVIARMRTAMASESAEDHD